MSAKKTKAKSSGEVSKSIVVLLIAVALLAAGTIIWVSYQ